MTPRRFLTSTELLAWAAEAAQIDISESLAVAILALLAVLPEYAVDFVFTWKSAHDPTQAHYAIANMTGANRLLVGLGWPAVLFIYVFAKKRKEILMDSSQRVEIFYLAMATLYSFTIPLKGSPNLIDTVILVTLFGLYTRRIAKMETVEPEMVGPVTFQALTGRPAEVGRGGNLAASGMAHIDLGQRADLIVIAPATANTLAKISWGMADNLLTTTVLSSTCPVVLAPAMNTRMWTNPLTRQHLEEIKNRYTEVRVVSPEAKRLACGDTGYGVRLTEPSTTAPGRLIGSDDGVPTNLPLARGLARQSPVAVPNLRAETLSLIELRDRLFQFGAAPCIRSAGTKSK